MTRQCRLCKTDLPVGNKADVCCHHNEHPKWHTEPPRGLVGPITLNIPGLWGNLYQDLIEQYSSRMNDELYQDVKQGNRCK